MTARGLKPKPTLGAILNKMVGALHHHPCAVCKAKFSCSCRTPAINGRCHACRPQNARPRPLWDRSGDPAECCWTNAQLLSDTTVLARYQLAGPGPWFQCKTCGRSQGFLPRR